MSRTDLLGSDIARALGARYTVAVRPDYPFLMEGPNLLVGGAGTLTGLFMPTLMEMRTPDLLLLRLAASRLALPPHMLCVLNLKTDSSGLINLAISRHFHAVRNSPSTIAAFIRSSKESSRE